jgi:hypothetical protein
MTAELREHALDLAARALGDRRAVEVGDGPLPTEAEAVTVLDEIDDRERLWTRLRRARDAAAAGVPVVVYVANHSLEPSGAGATPSELRDLFAGAGEVTFLEQRRIESSIAEIGDGPPERVAPPPGGPGQPQRLLVLANLPAPNPAEAALGAPSAAEPRRGEVERRLAELRARNRALADARIGTPPDETARLRARRAERRLLFARVREIVSALLSRRRLRG